MKMILHKFLTTLVLALLTLVLQANAFFPQGRANTKPSNNRRLIGGSASKVIRKRESKQLAQKIEELNDEIEDLTKRSKTRTDWVGGYFQKNPHLDYPKTEPDLSSVPIMDNHCNDQKLQRMQKVKYPEFSWLEDKADPSSRRYVKFYDDISRMGYTNTGRVYSIICPQIGFDLSRIGLCGTFNIEIHVDKTRGWVDEDTRTVCGDLTLYAIVWIDMNDAEKAKYPIRAKLQESFREGEFPFSKEHGTIIRAHYPGKPYEPICPVHNGTDPDYPIPEKRNHFDECYGVGHISTEVRLEKTGRPQHDHLNEILVDVMEIGLPGMLSDGSIVHWNLWFSPPEPVDPEEWRSHTEAMRLSVNDHDGRTSFDKHLAEVEDFDGNITDLEEKGVYAPLFEEVIDKSTWSLITNQSINGNAWEGSWAAGGTQWGRHDQWTQERAYCRSYLEDEASYYSSWNEDVDGFSSHFSSLTYAPESTGARSPSSEDLAPVVSSRWSRSAKPNPCLFGMTRSSIE